MAQILPRDTGLNERGYPVGKNDEDSVTFQIANVEKQLHVMDGLASAMSDPVATLRIIAEAEDQDGARSALITAYDLSEIQANAVLDNQFRRSTRRDLARLAQDRAEIAQQLDRLRAALPTK